MGYKVEPRKEYIITHANFNREDHFMDRVEVENARKEVTV